MRPEDVVATVWPGRPFDMEPLGGGITNHNFKVEFDDGETVVLRAPGKDTQLLGIDRQVESAAARMAASIGLGPEVIAFVADCLITRFVEGSPVPPEVMRRPENLARTADALRTLHQAPIIPGRFDSFRVVEEYAATAAEHGVDPPPDYEWAKGVADRIEETRGPQQLVPGHNDLLNANFIDAGDRLVIVDWEYAGMSDRFFDLANFSVNHELTVEQDREVLRRLHGSRGHRGRPGIGTPDAVYVGLPRGHVGGRPAGHQRARGRLRRVRRPALRSAPRDRGRPRSSRTGSRS